MKIPLPYLAAGALVGAALVWVAARGAQNAGEDLGRVGVDLVGGMLGGVVKSTAAAVGIPETNQTECQKAKAEGRTWDASFACPAGDFLSYVFN